MNVVIHLTFGNTTVQEDCVEDYKRVRRMLRNLLRAAQAADKCVAEDGQADVRVGDVRISVMRYGR